MEVPLMAILGPDRHGCYTLDWRDSNRKRHREKLGAMPYADVLLAHATRMARREAPSRLTVAAICRTYLRLHDVYAKHPFTDEGRVRAEGIVALIESDPLGSVVPGAMKPARFVAAVMLWRHGRSASVAPATLDREYNLLRAAMTLATVTGELDACPLPRGAVKRLVGVNDGKIVYFEPDEWQRFISARDDAFRSIFIALLWTVSRLSEIRLLRWEDVDLRAGTIRIQQGKTGRAKVIPIADELRADLESRPRGFGQTFVYADANGSAYSRKDIQRAFAMYRDAAGLRRELTPHSLRHTALSWMGIAGRAPQEMQLLAGHASLVMTMKYVHLKASHLKGGLDAMREAR
jgi:integrase